jgi:hypothetical protein
MNAMQAAKIIRNTNLICAPVSAARSLKRLDAAALDVEAVPLAVAAVGEAPRAEAPAVEAAMAETLVESPDEAERDEAVIAVVGGAVIVGQTVEISGRHAAIGHGVVAGWARVIGLR